MLPNRRPVPILMYHVIADPPALAPFPALYVSRAEFRAEIDWLARAGYEAVTLQQVFDSWDDGGSLPDRPIVLSFDDGYASHVTAALPVLQRRHWPGVLNLDLSNVAPPWGVSDGGIRRLVAAGWEVDAHSLTHADLTTLGRSALRREVQGSRAAIRRRFGAAANFFCYPSGHYNKDVVDAVQAAGYLGATTTEPGLATPVSRYELARIRVSRGDGARGLRGRLTSLGLPVDKVSRPHPSAPESRRYPGRPAPRPTSQ